MTTGRTIWRDEQPLILASQSPTRLALLENAGIAVEAVPAAIDERAMQAASGLTSPGRIAMLLARAKAADVASRYPGRLVLGADQTMALGAKLFNKPASRDEAARQLRLLVGRSHELHCAVTMIRDSDVLFAEIAIARLTMRPLRADAVAAYLDAAGDSVTSSVGGYQLEALGVHLFEQIDGDHFTILGLPLMQLLKFMRGAGLLAI